MRGSVFPGLVRSRSGSGPCWAVVARFWWEDALGSDSFCRLATQARGPGTFGPGASVTGLVVAFPVAGRVSGDAVHYLGVRPKLTLVWSMQRWHLVLPGMEGAKQVRQVYRSVACNFLSRCSIILVSWWVRELFLVRICRARSRSLCRTSQRARRLSKAFQFCRMTPMLVAGSLDSGR